MDYRERKYYLGHIQGSSMKERLADFKTVAPSLKIHEIKRYHGTFVHEIYGTYKYYPNVFLSCRIEDSEKLEFEIEMAEHYNKWTEFTEITKENEVYE